MPVQILGAVRPRPQGLMIHPELQVLRFVRLVDVESSMIKKHRAVAKIVSQVAGDVGC